LGLIPGLAVLGLLTLGLRERRLPETSAGTLRLTLRPFNADFRLYLLALTLFTLGNSSDAFLLVRAGELGVSNAFLPLLWCVFHIVKSAANLIAGYLTDRLGPKPLLLTGWLAYAFVYLAFALATNRWQICLIFFLYGIVYSLIEPASKAMVTRLTVAENKGLAFGWFNFAVGVTALPASLLFGWLYERSGALFAFGWGGALALAGAVALLAVGDSQRRTTSSVST
jgi:MFS family permease